LGLTGKRNITKKKKKTAVHLGKEVKRYVCTGYRVVTIKIKSQERDNQLTKMSGNRK
jgi:hypothetical protein